MLVLALLAALALTPRLLRRRVRSRRLAGTPEDIWDELCATAIDLSLPWPTGRSPQEVGRVLVDHLGDRTDTDRPERPRTGPDADPEAAAALERLVAALELARYARPGSAVPPAGLADDARTCCASLEAGRHRRVALRAPVAAALLWQRPRTDGEHATTSSARERAHASPYAAAATSDWRQLRQLGILEASVLAAAPALLDALHEGAGGLGPVVAAAARAAAFDDAEAGGVCHRRRLGRRALLAAHLPWPWPRSAPRPMVAEPSMITKPTIPTNHRPLIAPPMSTAIPTANTKPASSARRRAA